MTMLPDNESKLIHKTHFKQFGIVLELYHNMIKVFDESTGKFLKKYYLEREARVSAPVLSSLNDYLAWKNKIGAVYEVSLEVLELNDTLSTIDQYIFAVQYVPDLALGGHFGFYGWGLFSIESNKIKALFAQEAEKLMTGMILKQGTNAIILLGYESGLIEALELNPKSDLSKFNPTKAKLWETLDEHSVRSLTFVNEMVISVHKNGVVRVHAPQTGETLRSIKVTDNQALCITNDDQCCYVGTWNGEAVALDLSTWEVAWKAKLGDAPIKGSAVLRDGVCFVDDDYGIHLVAPRTGQLRQKIRSEIGVSSTPFQLRDWVVIGGAAKLLVFLGQSLIEAHPWTDNLIRAVHFHPYKILVGNDDGELSLWTYPGLKVKKE